MSSNRAFHSDVAIVGGGPVGLTLSLALAREGLTSTVFDSVDPGRFRGPNFDGRAYAMSLASRRLLESVGVWQRVASHAQPIADILVTDGRVSEGASSLYLRFSSGEFGAEGFGHMVEDRWLRGVLWNQVEACQEVTVRAPCEVIRSEAEGEGVTVQPAGGAEYRSMVVAACDGRSSPAARRAGITRTGWRYRQTALVCAIRHSKPHQGFAHEYFLPSGPFAILPLPGDVSSIVWTEERRAAEYIRRSGPGLFDSELRRRVGGFLGDIEVCSGRWFYPLEFSLADSYVADRLVLVGDSARRIHPIAGQGLNVGLQDIAAFARVVGEAFRRGEDIGRADVLRRYQAARRPAATALAFATDALNRLYSTDGPLLRLARDAGMAAVGSSGVLRRFFMQGAAGGQSRPGGPSAASPPASAPRPPA